MMNLRMLLREIFARAVLYSGTEKAIRLILWRDRVAFLLYHIPARLTRQASYYLKTIFNIILIRAKRGCPEADGRVRLSRWTTDM
jgi:hypothetical protein